MTPSAGIEPGTHWWKVTLFAHRLYLYLRLQSVANVSECMFYYTSILPHILPLECISPTVWHHVQKEWTENSSSYCNKSPGGTRAYERGGDARRLALGCKFRILISLRVFCAKTPLYLAVKVSFRVAREKHNWRFMTMLLKTTYGQKYSMIMSSLKVTVFFICLCFNMVSLRGRKKLGPRPDRSF